MTDAFLPWHTGACQSLATPLLTPYWTKAPWMQSSVATARKPMQQQCWQSARGECWRCIVSDKDCDVDALFTVIGQPSSVITPCGLLPNCLAACIEIGIQSHALTNN
jgi:hypothetical protein